MVMLIATDLDESLIFDHKLPKQNAEILRAIGEHNKKSNEKIYVQVISGRPNISIQKKIEEQGIADLFETEYFLTSGFNGCLTTIKDDALVDTPLSDSDKEIYFNDISRNVRDSLHFTKEDAYFKGTHPELERFIGQLMMKPVVHEADFRKKIYAFEYYCPSQEAAKELLSQISPFYKNGTHFSKFAAYMAMDPNSWIIKAQVAAINKGTAVQKSAEKLGIDMRNVISLGDHINDEHLDLPNVIPVTFGDSQPEIKELVRGKYKGIITKPASEGGFAYAISRILKDTLSYEFQTE